MRWRLSTGKLLAIFTIGICLGELPITFTLAEETKPPAAERKMPTYRVDAADFDASEADIRAICDSAGRELWRHFPDYKLEPFVVTRGRQGPIALFDRNERQEIVVRLDTGGTYWSQYSYQFAHEFCHVLAGFRAGESGNKWFEETLCETASLFVMRAMAKSWKSDPPYAHWADYRDSLRSYADDAMRGRDLTVIHGQGLAAFYRQHADHLRQNATDRDLNGAMAVVLLHVLEVQPERWEAIRWLNASGAEATASAGATGTAEAGDTSIELFARYLTRWHRAVPERHRAFVQQIGQLYGIEISPTAK